MKNENIKFIDREMQKIVENAVNRIKFKAHTSENEFVLELVREITDKYRKKEKGDSFCKKNSSKEREFPIPIGLEYPFVDYDPSDFNFGGTDLVVFDNKKFCVKNALGFEAKILGNHHGNSENSCYRNVEYFFTGTHSGDEGDGHDYQRGGYLKKSNGGIEKKSHCKEGQLVKDYIKAVKVLNKHKQSMKVIYLIGVIVRKVDDGSGANSFEWGKVQTHIKKLLKDANNLNGQCVECFYKKDKCYKLTADEIKGISHKVFVCQSENQSEKRGRYQTYPYIIPVYFESANELLTGSTRHCK